MDLPIHLLQGLVAIGECNSLAKAAEALNLTQPALSMQLKKLEELFELPIFEFHGKRKVLTPYGRSCYLEAKRLINEFNLSFENLNRQFLDSSKLTLRVAGRRELLFRAQKSISFGGKISFNAMSSKEALIALESRTVDVAISRVKPNSSDIIAKKFLTNCPWLVTHKKWTKGKDLSTVNMDKDFLRKTPLITYSDDVDFMRNWLHHAGVSTEELNTKYICGDWLAVLHMIESGLGYAIIPDSIESNLSDVIHIELPCSVVRPETYYFLYNKSLSKMPAYRNIFALNL